MQQLHHEDDATEMVLQMQRANGLEPKEMVIQMQRANGMEPKGKST